VSFGSGISRTCVFRVPRDRWISAGEEQRAGNECERDEGGYETGTKGAGPRNGSRSDMLISGLRWSRTHEK